MRKVEEQSLYEMDLGKDTNCGRKGCAKFHSYSKYIRESFTAMTWPYVTEQKSNYHNTGDAVSAAIGGCYIAS